MKHADAGKVMKTRDPPAVPHIEQPCTVTRRMWYSSLTQTISTHRCSFGSARVRILTSCSAETVPEVHYSLRAVQDTAREVSAS